jgi:muramidase (phage lysozyme)
VTPNMAAFLTMTSVSEGTDNVQDANRVAVDPYRTTFQGELSPGVKKPMHVIVDLNWHPAEVRPDGTREWGGESLAFLGPRYIGEVSTAAGRYQITKPTWLRCKAILLLNNFGPGAQDDVAVQLIKEVHALDLVNSGQIALAINQCHGIWASLPGSQAGQPITPFAKLLATYGDAGGGFA